MNDTQTNLIVGKYLVSPLIKLMDDGRYAASVSIRSGSGRCTHDRVFRFIPPIIDRLTASQYAQAEGLAWIRHQNPSLAA